MSTSGLDNNGDRTLQFEAMVNAYSKDLYRYGLWLTKDAPGIRRPCARDLLESMEGNGSTERSKSGEKLVIYDLST